ncbi:hypothetical protein K8I28_09035 [bacterium]|nr:hypothetical protein [bacterium]
MEDIKQFYLREIATNPHRYAFEDDFPSNETNKFTGYLQCILNADNESNTVESVNNLIKNILTSHGKEAIFGPANYLIRIIELRLKITNQKLHYLHLPNVFLLGLLLYEKCFEIQRNINIEILRTIKGIPECSYDENAYFLSSGSLKGEFLFRWRLASLCHDLGYIVTLEAGLNPQEGINELKVNNLITDDEIDNVEDLYKYRNKNLLRLINAKIKRLDLVKYVEKFKECHYEDRYFEHGLLSAVLFLRLVCQHFDKHKRNDPILVSNGNATCIHKTLLKTTLLQVAKAIALHNIEKSSSSIAASCLGKDFKMDAERDALSCLLKICDMLQEWDKPPSCGSGELVRNAYNIQFKDDYIQIQGFPQNTEGILNTLKLMKGLENFIIFE